MKALTEMKTLIINGKCVAAGSIEAIERYAKRVVRKQRLEKSDIKYIKGIITKLEEAV